jgi:hypothetical protein
MKVALVGTGSEQCVALQVDGLPIIDGRNAHATDEHRRKTPNQVFSKFSVTRGAQGQTDVSPKFVGADINAVARLRGTFRPHSGQISTEYFDKYRF